MNRVTRRQLLNRTSAALGLRIGGPVFAGGLVTSLMSSSAQADYRGYDDTCTGWVAERLHRQAERTGDSHYEIPTGLGDAGTWYQRASWHKHPRLVVAGAVACWSGHVAYVERVTNRVAGIYISEGGWMWKAWNAGGYHEEELLLAAGRNDMGNNRRALATRGMFHGFLFPPALWTRATAFGFRRVGAAGWFDALDRRIA